MLDRERLAQIALEELAQAGLALTWEEWKQDANALFADAKALGRDISERKLLAHLAAVRARSDAIDENTAKIVNRVRKDERAQEFAAERRRPAEEQALAIREAERLRLEEEGKQDQSEGSGISMS